MKKKRKKENHEPPDRHQCLAVVCFLRTNGGFRPVSQGSRVLRVRECADFEPEAASDFGVYVQASESKRENINSVICQEKLLPQTALRASPSSNASKDALIFPNKSRLCLVTTKAAAEIVSVGVHPENK